MEEFQDPTPENSPTLTIGDSVYDLNSLPESCRRLIAGLRMADSSVSRLRNELALLTIAKAKVLADLQEELKTCSTI